MDAHVTIVTIVTVGYLKQMHFFISKHVLLFAGNNTLIHMLLTRLLGTSYLLGPITKQGLWVMTLICMTCLQANGHLIDLVEII